VLLHVGILAQEVAGSGFEEACIQSSIDLLLSYEVCDLQISPSFQLLTDLPPSCMFVICSGRQYPHDQHQPGAPAPSTMPAPLEDSSPAETPLAVTRPAARRGCCVVDTPDRYVRVCLGVAGGV
jgi:hypothetical protein